ncbi:MAG: tRNA adenosine(34) deaminase TadA [Spirochaetes bacterium]|nr:tRNA adenosine(34) deaminase TadA [Spirochaetota bacterium]
MNKDHHMYMAIALEEAKLAEAEDEIPVGAVIVMGDQIIARAHNKTRQCSDPTAHAEMLAIKDAASYLHNERLVGCSMYVTKEPCAMCAGAIVHARIETLIIGTKDYRFGACGTVLAVCGNTALNHTPEMVFGICQEECKTILQNFFKKLRPDKS